MAVVVVAVDAAVEVVAEVGVPAAGLRLRAERHVLRLGRAAAVRPRLPHVPVLGAPQRPPRGPAVVAKQRPAQAAAPKVPRGQAQRRLKVVQPHSARLPAPEQQKLLRAPGRRRAN